MQTDLVALGVEEVREEAEVVADLGLGHQHPAAGCFHARQKRREVVAFQRGPLLPWWAPVLALGLIVYIAASIWIAVQ